MTARALNGKFRRLGERERRTPALLVVAVKSPAHVKGAATKLAKWNALRDSKTADLRAGR